MFRVRKLRTKLVLGSISIILVSLLLFLFFSFEQTKKDKKIYLIETLNNRSQKISLQIATAIRELMMRSNFIFVNQNSERDDLIGLQKGINFALYQIEGETIDMMRTSELDFGVEQKVLLKEKSFLEKQGRFVSSRIRLVNGQFTIGIFLFNTDYSQFAYLEGPMEGVSDLTDDLESFKYSIVHKKRRKVIYRSRGLAGIAPKAKELTRKQSLNSTKQIELAGEKYFIHSSEISNSDFLLLTMIKSSLLFEGHRPLFMKSLAMALFLIGLAIIIVAFLSKKITDPLVRLTGLSMEIAGGNFEQSVPVKGSDEVSQLSESINSMAFELKNFVEEVAGKAALEKELELASIVQDQFISAPEIIDFGGIQVYGYYTPASQCSGDWWAVKEMGDLCYTFVGDATGHGAPAAFITVVAATVHNLLDQICKNYPEAQRPSMIMEFLNKAVCGLGGQVMMTHFISVYNKKTSELIYTCASHNPPLLIPNGCDNHRKFQLLDQNNGTRLGEDKEANYKESKMTLNSGDTIVYYTDGITEFENPDEKQYGERRFLKLLAELAPMSIDEIVQNTVDELEVFGQGAEATDDITMVVQRKV